MPNIFYKIQYKTELETLNLELKNSKCNGLLIPKKLFLKTKQENDQKEIDETFVKTIKSFNKKIILYKNYHSLRPSLVDPNKLIDKKHKEKATKKYEKFKNKCNLKDTEKYFLKEINEYNEIIKFTEHYLKEKPKSIIESRLFKGNPNFEINKIILPYIPSIPEKFNRKSDFHNKLIQLTNKKTQILDNVINKYLNKYDLVNQLYTITLSLEDYKNNPNCINALLRKSEKFRNVGLWIIDFNDVNKNTTKKPISHYHDIISKFNNLNISLFIYYSGAFSVRLIEKINPEINNIIRIDGYPGLNVNIPARVTRSRKFYYQNNGNFYNEINFSNTFLRKKVKEKYKCNCLVCSEYNIKDFRRVLNFFIANPKDNDDYAEFIGRAKKTKEKKLRAKQKVFLMRHNFHNLDRHLNMNKQDFKDLIFKSNYELENWKDFI